FAWLLQGRLGTGKGPQIANGTPAAAGTPLPLPTVAPAAPPIAGTPLSWQQVALVPGTTTNDSLSVAFSTASADVIYACRISATAGAHPEVWVSRDRGAQWSKLADLPVDGELFECSASADRQNPGAVLIGVRWRPDGTSSYRPTDYVVKDNGAWHALPT